MGQKDGPYTVSRRTPRLILISTLVGPATVRPLTADPRDLGAADRRPERFVGDHALVATDHEVMVPEPVGGVQGHADVIADHADVIADHADVIAEVMSP
jgi:hypothetical protein